MKKVFITTLGCKVNQFESAAYHSGFAEHGFITSRTIEDAQVIIINTCAVTAKASCQSRQELRKALRRNQQAQVIVTGCQATMASGELRKEHARSARRLHIITNNSKDTLVSQVLGHLPNATSVADADRATVGGSAALKVDHFPNRTRALLKVQDGCDSFCSYCIVPYTRGSSRSIPVDKLIRQAKTFAHHGHQEIVITGIHLGLYGKDLRNNIDISQLIERLCLATPAVRYRLSSIEPTEISPKLLTLMSDLTNFMPHFHIPLQSGDNDILRRMNRQYSREVFKAIVEKCRAIIPEAAIGFDVLVGFPGEGEHQFMNSLNLIQELDCTYLHVFPYSRRPGTKAAAFSEAVTKSVKTQRVKTLRTISSQKSQAFYSRFLGTQRAVLVEHEPDHRSGLLKGFTDNYIPVRLNHTPLADNRLITVTLQRVDHGSVAAVPVS